MRFIKISFIVIALLFLVACTEKKETALTVAPYELTEKEQQILRKTSVDHIEFFTLNGTLADDEDLQFSIEVIENGVMQESYMKTYGALERSYDDAVIAFEALNMNNSNRTLKLTMAGTSEKTSTFHDHDKTGFSFGRLINEPVKLEKNKPLYVASWQGTTKNALFTVGGRPGELPEGIEHYELVLLYTVLWTDESQ